APPQDCLCQFNNKATTMAQAGQAAVPATWSERCKSLRCESVTVADRKFLGREQRDHAAALVRHHDLLLDAGGGIAVGGGAIGFEREHHALLDFGRMVKRHYARDDR